MGAVVRVGIWVRSPVFRVSDQANLNSAGDLVASVAVTGRADLTDAQWARLAPLLPRGKKAGRPPKWTKRQLIDWIRWRTRVSSPWRDVPVEYGSWLVVYGLFRRWQRAGGLSLPLDVVDQSPVSVRRILITCR
ncbi:transposase [Nocardia sp. SYP-A9097]|uniref:transposase n=1 Tax=Nocardia sp. SYP-A9097 TaxID=2663237 RepID=UPI001E5F5E37|nr:transposase [Nocardia sp. SYP-A9097]